MKLLSLLVLAALAVGCNARQEITMPATTVGALNPSEVTQMGKFGANLPRTATVVSPPTNKQ